MRMQECKDGSQVGVLSRRDPVVVPESIDRGLSVSDSARKCIKVTKRHDACPLKQIIGMARWHACTAQFARRGPVRKDCNVECELLTCSGCDSDI